MYVDEIKSISKEIKDELIKIRRNIHSHPEIALHENRTSSFIAQTLRELGLEVKTNVGVTGVIGLLRGKYEGKTILLRADMDCLKMTELNDVEYKSKNPGLMHACGHDAHVTWILGTAMILSRFKDRLHGNVKFLFEPAEEGVGGAKIMIKEGALEDPHVDAAIGAHVWPSIPAGKIGVKYGPMMAAPDRFLITIHGKGGHGAIPQDCIDPISISFQIYMGIQSILTRKLDPIEPSLISICRFTSGSAFNVIPDKAEMEGTVRTVNSEVRKQIPELMEMLIKGITNINGATYDFVYTPYFPAVVNNNVMSDLVENAGFELLGEDRVITLDKPVMIGEDFSYFQKKVPAVFFAIGTYNEKKNVTYDLHSAHFNIDEDILSNAAALFSLCVFNYLNKDEPEK